jgi:hypothetical protein
MEAANRSPSEELFALTSAVYQDRKNSVGLTSLTLIYCGRLKRLFLIPGIEQDLQEPI